MASITTSETTTVGIRFYELLSDGDLDGVLDLVSDDFVGHGLGGGGRDSLRQDLAGFRSAFPDLSLTVEDTITEGDKVAVKTTMRGTHQGPFAGIDPSGNHIEVGGCDIFQVRAGQIVEAWTMCDSGTMFMQTGALPAPRPS